MDGRKKKRGENWSSEEKEILQHLVAQSASILEDKSTKTNINILKVREWKKVTSRFNEIVSKKRAVPEIKLAWKRMKIAAKSKISLHSSELHRTGGGGKSLSPSHADLKIKEVCKENTEDSVIQSNINYKKRNLEMSEAEHVYNIEIAKLTIKKLKLEIEILEAKKSKQNEELITD